MRLAVFLLLPVLLQAAAGARPPPWRRQTSASTAPHVERWEGFVLHLAATLRAHHHLSGTHFVCRAASRCASSAVFRRLGRLMTVPHTMHVGDALPPSWSSTPGKLFILVGLNCNAIANVTADYLDVVVLVSSRSAEVGRAAAAFETCWRANLLNVLAVMHRGGVTAGGGLQVFTYEPYHPGQCHDLRPRPAAVWSPGTPRRPDALGLQPKDRQLGGCPIRVVTVDARPYIELHPANTTSRFLLVGTYSQLMYTMAEYLNFTPVFSPPSDGKMYGNPVGYPEFGGLLGDVFWNRSDLGLVFSGADLQLNYHERPSTAQVACTTWCLPTGFAERSLWRSLVGEFTPDSWACVLAAYAVGVVTYRCLLRHKSFQDTWLTALQGMLSAIDPVPKDWPARAFMFCWSFYGLVLATLYVAEMHGINTAETDDTVFHSLSELAASKLPLYAATDYLRTYKKAQWDTASETRIMRRVRPFHFVDARPLYARLFAKRDMGLLMDRNACVAYANMFTPPRQAPVFHVVRGYCLAVSASYNFVVRRGSPLYRRLTKTTALLDEGGLTQFWMDVKARDFWTKSEPAMTLKQLHPFLRLLAIGLTAAAAVFVVEHVFFWGDKCCSCFRTRTPPAEAEGHPDGRHHQHHYHDHYDHHGHLRGRRRGRGPPTGKRDRLLREAARPFDGRWDDDGAPSFRRRPSPRTEFDAYLRKAAAARSVY